MPFSNLSEYTASHLRNQLNNLNTKDHGMLSFTDSLCTSIESCYSGNDNVNPETVYNSIDKLNILVNKLIGESVKTKAFETCIIHMAKLFKINGFSYLTKLLTSNQEDALEYISKSRYCFKNYYGLINLAFDDADTADYTPGEYLLLCDIFADINLLYHHYNSIQEDVGYTGNDFPKIDFRKAINLIRNSKISSLHSYATPLSLMLKALQSHSQNNIGESLGYINYCIEILLERKECKVNVKEYRQKTDTYLKESKKAQKFKTLKTKLKIKKPVSFMKNKGVANTDIEEQFVTAFINEICVPLLFLVKLSLEDLNNNVSFESVPGLAETQEGIEFLFMDLEVSDKALTNKETDNGYSSFGYKWTVTNGVLIAI